MSKNKKIQKAQPIKISKKNKAKEAYQFIINNLEMIHRSSDCGIQMIFKKQLSSADVDLARVFLNPLLTDLQGLSASDFTVAPVQLSCFVTSKKEEKIARDLISRIDKKLEVFAREFIKGACMTMKRVSSTKDLFTIAQFRFDKKFDVAQLTLTTDYLKSFMWGMSGNIRAVVDREHKNQTNIIFAFVDVDGMDSSKRIEKLFSAIGADLRGDGVKSIATLPAFRPVSVPHNRGITILSF